MSAQLATPGPIGQVVGPSAVIIFGSAGDLTLRKLAPALYKLAGGGLLPDQFAVVGFANREWSHDVFRDQVDREWRAHVPGELDPRTWEWLVERMYFVPGDLEDAAAYQRLQEVLTQVSREGHDPKHPGVPLCERYLRADLEPAVCGP